MSFEPDVRTFLLADAAIAALVGTRVHPLNLPQKSTLPAVTVERIDTTRESTHDGPEGMQRARMRVSCWALTLLAARDLADKVRRRLHGFVGTMGAGTVVQASFMDSDSDDFQSDPEMYVADLDFEIWAQEVV